MKYITCCFDDIFGDRLNTVPNKIIGYMTQKISAYKKKNFFELITILAHSASHPAIRLEIPMLAAFISNNPLTIIEIV